MSRDSRIRCVVIGSVSETVRNIIDDLNLKSTLKRKIKFIEHSDNEAWEKNHKSGNLGIRLGVGSNGECSGLVRDYVSFGMKVITDESTPDLAKIKNVRIVKDEITPDALAESIIELLGEDFEIDNELQFKKSRIRYESEIKKIIGNQLGR